MWSAAQTESSPAASACSATSRMACGSSMPIVGNETPYSAMRPLSVILVLDVGHGNSRARREPTDRRHTDGRFRPLLATTSAPPHDAPIPLPYLLWPCRMPPRNPASWRRGAPARFTSKCRKMSQNVALFHTPTRRMAHFTSKKPHVFDQNRAFWARFCSFSALAPGNGLSLRPLGACSILPAPRSRNRGRPQGRTTLVERRAHGS